MNPDPDVPPAGAGAEPLDAEEQARWDAVAAHAADAAEAVITGDPEGLAAAVGALGLSRLDHARVLDALHVPVDAGDLAPALERILRRIPDGWGRWISCGPGWYSILARLDTQLAAIDPGYIVHQVKEKFGGLRYYAEPSPPRCCEAWDGAHPLPDPDDNQARQAWEAAFAAHDDSPEHRSAIAAMAARRAAMDAEITRAETEAAVTCEVTGAPGRLMVRSGWYRTLASDVAEDKGYRPVQR